MHITLEIPDTVLALIETRRPPNDHGPLGSDQVASWVIGVVAGAMLQRPDAVPFTPLNLDARAGLDLIEANRALFGEEFTADWTYIVGLFRER